jgi:hypothetical protein
MKLVHLSSGGKSTDEAIRSAQDGDETVMLLWGTFCQLANEMGGQPSAVMWLHQLVATTDRPLAFSTPSCESAAETHILTPPDWSEERTLGWLSGLRAEAEALFGSTTVFHERQDGYRTRWA